MGCPYEGDVSRLRGKIVVLPTVSQGSVPQLTVDLLVYSLRLERIGYLHDADCVVPMLGAADVTSDQASTFPDLVTGGIEVFGSDACSYVFCQQRAPTIASKKARHAALIAQFLATSSFAAVLLLTSMDISSSTDEYDLMSPYRSIISEEVSKSDASLIGKLREIPAHASHPTSHGLQVSAPLPAIPDMPGSGSARRILQELAKDPQTPPYGTLATWCAEADNRPDVHGLANVVLFCLGQGSPLDLKEPPSWAGLFGGTSIRTGGIADVYG